MRQTCGWEVNGTFYGRLWLRSAKKILKGVLRLPNGDVWLRECVWLLSESVLIVRLSWKPACHQHIQWLLRDCTSFPVIPLAHITFFHPSSCHLWRFWLTTPAHLLPDQRWCGKGTWTSRHFKIHIRLETWPCGRLGLECSCCGSGGLEIGWVDLVVNLHYQWHSSTSTCHCSMLASRKMLWDSKEQELKCGRRWSSEEGEISKGKTYPMVEKGTFWLGFVPSGSTHAADQSCSFFILDLRRPMQDGFKTLPSKSSAGCGGWEQRLWIWYWKGGR